MTYQVLTLLCSAGFAGAFIDLEFESKGLDFIDKEKAKRHAREQAEGMYDEHYGGQDQYDPSQQGPPPGIQGNW